MITREIVLTVPGVPAPKGSLICCRDRRHSLREDNTKTKPWRTAIAKAARTLVQQTADPGQPVIVEATCTLARPRSHYRTGRNADTLKDSAPTYPSVQRTGDSDKLARTILDALEDSGILVNDVQVVDQTCRKVYPDSPHRDAREHPGAVIRIRPVST